MFIDLCKIETTVAKNLFHNYDENDLNTFIFDEEIFDAIMNILNPNFDECVNYLIKNKNYTINNKYNFDDFEKNYLITKTKLYIYEDVRKHFIEERNNILNIIKLLKNKI